MPSNRIDKSIVQLRFSSHFLIFSSLVIFTISMFLGSDFANRAEDDLLRITNIVNNWPRTTPRHLKTIVSDITIGSPRFSGNMGYVAFHSSSLFSSTFDDYKLFFSSGNHDAAVMTAKLYQESALPLLQQIYSSTPKTLSEFRRAWDHLAFPMYFMQFHSSPNWYLGTIDESSFVSWMYLGKDYMPNVPPAVHRESPIELSLSNKYSQWNIFGNAWRGDDSSPQMKSDLDNGDGWFLYAKYAVHDKQYLLVGILRNPVLVEVLPLHSIPGHEFDISSSLPFSKAFPWISEYADRFSTSGFEQLRQYLKVKEQIESNEVSIFGVSITQNQVVLFALPIILVLQLRILLQIFDITSYVKTKFSDEAGVYYDSEPWMLFSDSRVSFCCFLLALCATPLISSAAAVYALMDYSEGDGVSDIFFKNWISIHLLFIVVSASGVLLRNGIMLRRLRLDVLEVTARPC